MSVPATRPEGHRTPIAISLAASLGVLLGLALVVPQREAAEGPDSMLLGGRISDAAEAADEAVERAERHLASWFNLELPGGAQRRVSTRTLGAALDRPRLRRLVREAAGALGTRPRAFPSSAAPIDLPVPIALDHERAVVALLALKAELDQPAVDARLDLDASAVIPERAGRRLDVDRSLAAIEQALERGALAAPLSFDTDPPERFARDLDGVRHDVLLGFFETAFDANTSARAHNLKLAASRLDGHVLLPGTSFDFNAVVGPRDEAAGYRLAAVLAAGERVDGSGSSTSQLAGTLHAAALFAGLEIIERHPSALPDAVDLGLEAMVAYPGLSLRLMNPYDFPVVLRAVLARGQLRAEVLGAERPHIISVMLELDRATPFARLESDDPTLARGVRVVAQRGVAGIDLQRYRIRRTGAHAVREVLRERYPPSPELVRVGTGARTAVAHAPRMHDPNAGAASTAGRPPHEGSTPVPLAYELWVLNQTSDVDAPLVQHRVPGRFAAPGWSKNIGAPAWNADGQAPALSGLRPGAGEFLNP